MHFLSIMAEEMFSEDEIFYIVPQDMHSFVTKSQNSLSTSKVIYHVNILVDNFIC